MKRAENYRWGSLPNWLGGGSQIELAIWPIRRLPNWAERVNEVLTAKELEATRHSVVRGKPFGDDKWTASTGTPADKYCKSSGESQSPPAKQQRQFNPVSEPVLVTYWQQ